MGYLRTTRFAGFVIWLSTDGATWRWVPVPVDLPNGQFVTRTVGTDVVLSPRTAGGELAWRITGLDAVFG